MSGIFEHIPTIYFIYFFYGASFLILSAAISAKNMKESELKAAGALPLLALFGLTHGIHEWMQIYPLIEGGRLSFHALFLVRFATLAVLIVSYVFLLLFGFNLVKSATRLKSRLLWIVPLVLFLLWLAGAYHPDHGLDLQFLRQVSIGARHTLGLAGGIMTAASLIIYAKEIRILNAAAARNFRFSGVSFAFYAFFAGVFSSNFAVLPLPVPIEVFRGVSAACITYFIIKALNIFDIETRKRMREQARRMIQAEKLTSLGQLAAGIAHEINTPLTNASLGIQMLRKKIGELPLDTARSRLEMIELNIDRASSIARELLLFSRQQEGVNVPVDVNKVIESALTLLQFKLKNMTLDRKLEQVPPIQGDPGKLEQVLINIFSNAVEAMPDGGRISVATAVQGEAIRIEVADNGAGIAPQHLPRLFDPFFTTKETGKGTGLGLSICYGIIHQMNGTIDVASTPGRGTTVSIEVPSWRTQ